MGIELGFMANLRIRKLSKYAYDQLRIRAANHGVSIEEVRQIIYRAVGTPGRITDIFQKYFGEKNGADLEMPNRREPHEPLDFIS